MAHVYDHLGTARPWHDAHCDPIVDALFAGDEAAAQAALARCRELLPADPALSPDERRALEYVLHDYERAIVDHFRGAAASAAQFPRSDAAVRALSPAGPLSDGVQAKVLLSFIGAGARRGFLDADEAGVEALLARIPEEYRTPNIWYYIVAWAFHHDNLKLLGLALEEQTVATTGYLDDYYWLRTNLMYQLVAGKATRLDVEKTLRGYNHPLQCVDFRNLFLERCSRAGLMDDELRSLLVQREAELAELRGTEPKPSAKTGRIVREH